MCVLNRQATAALGSSTISIAYADWPHAIVPPAFVGIQAGNPRWLNDSVLLCQANIGGSFVLVTFEVTPALDKPLVGCNALGQNELYAGGSRWAARLAKAGLPIYRDSFGASNDAWFVQDVDQLTGLIAIYNDADGHTYVWGGANLSPVTGFALVPQPCFKDGTLLYRTSNGPKFGAWPALSVAPAQINVQGGRSGCWHSGGWRLSFPNDALGLVVHGWADTSGLQLHAPGESTVHDNNPDIQAMPDGTIQVVSAKTEGEMPSDFQRYIVNMTARTVNGHPRAWVNLA